MGRQRQVAEPRWPAQVNAAAPRKALVLRDAGTSRDGPAWLGVLRPV